MYSDVIPETPAFEMDSTEGYEILPAKTFRLDKTNGRIIGVIDDSEAVMQFIKKVLDTDKYAYEIYDWYYGHRLLELVGQPYEYVVANIPPIIEEALCCDDRIKGVRDFTFEQTSLDSCHTSFFVDTIYGSYKAETEVPL